jgi:hypothetical protein
MFDDSWQFVEGGHETFPCDSAAAWKESNATVQEFGRLGTGFGVQGEKLG